MTSQLYFIMAFVTFLASTVPVLRALENDSWNNTKGLDNADYAFATFLSVVIGLIWVVSLPIGVLFLFVRRVHKAMQRRA